MTIGFMLPAYLYAHRNNNKLLLQQLGVPLNQRCFEIDSMYTIIIHCLEKKQK